MTGHFQSSTLTCRQSIFGCPVTIGDRVQIKLILSSDEVIVWSQDVYIIIQILTECKERLLSPFNFVGVTLRVASDDLRKLEDFSSAGLCENADTTDDSTVNSQSALEEGI